MASSHESGFDVERFHNPGEIPNAIIAERHD